MFGLLLCFASGALVWYLWHACARTECLVSQVSALTAKNVKINLRTEFFGMRCCNACCLQILVPVLFTALLTAVPDLFLQSANFSAATQEVVPVAPGLGLEDYRFQERLGLGQSLAALGGEQLAVQRAAPADFEALVRRALGANGTGSGIAGNSVKEVVASRSRALAPLKALLASHLRWALRSVTRDSTLHDSQFAGQRAASSDTGALARRVLARANSTDSDGAGSSAKDLALRQRLGLGLPLPPVDMLSPGRDVRGEIKEALAEVFQIPAVVATMFAPNVMLIAYFLIRERNSRQAELVKLVGLCSSARSLSWLALFAGVNFIAALGSAMLIYSYVMQRSSFLLLLLMLFTCGMATTAVGMAVSPLADTDRLGAMVSFGVYFAAGLVSRGLPGSDPDRPIGDADAASALWLYAASVLPPVAFILCLKTYMAMDATPGGCPVAKMFVTYQKYSVGAGVLAMALSFCIWGILYAYLEEVMKHDVGTGRQWCLPLARRFWGGGGTERRAGADCRRLLAAPDGDRPAEELKGDPLFEPEDTEELRALRRVHRVISVRGLRKVFRNAAGATVCAVDGLNFTMYEGECFCLLGHNGAGKSTAMAMIAGVLPPTAGEVSVLGHCMPGAMAKVRCKIGFCLQQNVLWDTLKVEEHIHLFGKLMGFSESVIASSCSQVLEKVELTPKRAVQATALSGGMKRKLNVALALFGDAPVVILDEPTAGMDPHTRRQLLARLKQCRAGRVLCLTTHCMDEADELGDRICVMVRGRAACRGRNDFLRRALGCGYVLSLVKAVEAVDDGPVRALVHRHCGAHDVAVASAAGRELRLRVPFAAAGCLPALTRELDAKLQSLGLETYGVGVSDLEDVFLKAAGGEVPGAVASPPAGPVPGRGGAAAADEAAGAGVAAALLPPPLPSVEPPSRPRPQPLLRWQFGALLQRRVSYGRRDTRMCCCQLLMPPLTLAIFMVLQGAVGHQLLDSPIAIDSAVDRAPPATAGLKDAPMHPSPATARTLPTAADLLHAFSSSSPSALGDPRALRGVPHRDREPLAPEPAAAQSRSTYGGDPVAKSSSTSLNGPPQFALSEEVAEEGVASLLTGGALLVAYAFVPATIAAYMAMEQELEVKHQLMVSGTSRLAYWASNAAFDGALGLVSVAISLVVFRLFGLPELVETRSLPATTVLLLLYTPAAAMHAYFLSFFFSSAGGALATELTACLIVGTFGVQVPRIFLAFKETRFAGNVILWTARVLVPTVPLSNGLAQLVTWKGLSEKKGLSPFSGILFGSEFCFGFVELPCAYNAGDDALVLAVDAVLYAVLVLLMEVHSDRLSATRDRGPKCPAGMRLRDEAQVREERARVERLDPSSQVLVLDDVYKTYGDNVYAVRGVTYAVDGGQVFGLLGVNGAGKTTTFKLMCGQLRPSAGRVLVQGMDVSQNLGRVRSLIGYCPQFNALLDLLTVREHLELYVQIKGFSGLKVEDEVQKQMKLFDLAGFEHSLSCQLSGGNARKLSAAVAMVGEPPLVFLDEPSAGMDPVARRFMWEVIRAIACRRRDGGVVLTTHTTEEADALCSRIAIQASGQLRCLGTPQQLKARFGAGLELRIRLAAPSRGETAALRDSLLGSEAEAEALDEAARAELLLARWRAGRGTAAPQEDGSAKLPLPRKGASLGALAEWCLLQERSERVLAFLRQGCGRESLSVVEVAAETLRLRLDGHGKREGPLSYGELFANLQQNSADLCLADFQLSHGTLERAFSQIAAEDMERQARDRVTLGDVAAAVAPVAETCP